MALLMTAIFFILSKKKLLVDEGLKLISTEPMKERTSLKKIIKMLNFIERKKQRWYTIIKEMIILLKMKAEMTMDVTKNYL